MTTRTSLTRTRRHLLALAIGQALMGTASAATIVVETGSDSISQDGFCSIREALGNANSLDASPLYADCDAGSPAVSNRGGLDTIQFRPTVREIKLSEALTISSNVSIQGRDPKFARSKGGETPRLQSISGEGLSRIFEIEGDVRVDLFGLSLTNGKTLGFGGAISAPSGGSLLRIDSCALTGNSASSGGALHANGSLFISGSNFESNVATKWGGAVFRDTNASYANTDVQITDTSIQGNSAELGGGIFFSDDAAISRSSLTYNRADEGGGMFVTARGDVIVTDNTRIENNEASNSGGGIRNHGRVSLLGDASVGGAFQSYGATVDNNIVEDGYGGGIFNEGIMTIADSRVQGNTADDGGGGIYNGVTRSLSISDGTLIDNNATGSGGGGIRNDGYLTLADSQVTGNRAESGGGIYSLDDASTMVTNSLVSGNTASDLGGGVYAHGALTISSATTISENTASEASGVFSGSDLIVTDSSISDNVVLNSSQVAGGILALGSTTIIDSTIADNEKVGVSLDGPSTNELHGVRVLGNGGSGVTINGGTTTIGNAFIADNGSITGGLYIQSGIAQLESSTVWDNHAEVGAGVFNSGTLSVSNSTISANRADNAGGGFYNQGFLSIHSSTVFENVAVAGRGEGLYNDGTVNIVNSIVAGGSQQDCYLKNFNDIVRNQGNLIEDGTCSEGAVGMLTGDPKLDSLRSIGGPTPAHPVATGSPVVDAGETSECFAGGEFDQTGANRSVDGDADGDANCDIGAVEFVDIYPPLVFIDDLEGPFPGNQPYRFQVQYRDVDGRIDTTSLGDGDLLVAGPDGSNYFPTLITNLPAVADSVFVTYELLPPGGDWGSADTGFYSIVVQPEEVFDLAASGANPIPAKVVGRFTFSDGRPLVQDAVFEFEQTARPDQAIGQVVATDVDGQIPELGAYAITAGNQAEHFYIDDDGVIRNMNGETPIGDWVLNVTVTDTEGLQGSAEIIIKVRLRDRVFRSGFELLLG